jgi:hypothetical protein
MPGEASLPDPEAAVEIAVLIDPRLTLHASLVDSGDGRFLRAAAAQVLIAL